jgi:hypothetical protein
VVYKSADDQRARRIVATHHTSFDGVAYPGDDEAMIEPGVDSSFREKLAANWRGRRWQDVPLAWLASNGEDALHFMTPAAIHYYMPAFLKAIVTSIRSMDVSADALLAALTPPPPSSRFRESFDNIAATLLMPSLRS